MSETKTAGARALELFLGGKDAPEIAKILTAEQPHGSRITPDQARDLYQAEFRRTRRLK